MINLYKSVLFRYIFFREKNTKNATSFSRRLLFIVIFFSFILMHVQTTMAQMVEVSFSNKVQQSTLIVEAKVIQKQASWNDAHTRIYTANELEIYKVFKGQLPSMNCQIITQGGIVGNDKHEVHPSLQLSLGDVGVFFLQESTANLTEINGFKLSSIASHQGFYRYDDISGRAISPFDYNQLVNQLHTAIQAQTNQVFTQNIPFTFETLQFPESGLVPVITSVSPSTINAGVGDTLTITGTGFDTLNPTTSKVQFLDAAYGTFIWYQDVSNFISWTDSVIELAFHSC